ncbi:hypothetical protein HJFPF1_13196 [Paramyrothecium foliicola]|nr:hypothetical protein HJFPF1_13196 [Paramyrothecium foliicola]
MEPHDPQPGRIVMASWSGLAELRTQEDDWTGVNNWKERKKRQNRLHQRAIRRRKRAQGAGSDPQPISSTGWAIRIDTSAGPTSIQSYKLARSLQDQEVIRRLQAQAYQDFTLDAPRPTFLPILIRINALNALLHNARKIGISADTVCRDEEISPFNLTGPLVPASTAPLPECPEDLRPTTLQKTIFHHPWIDLLPLPQLRDNLLRALSLETFDVDEFCVEVFHPGAAGNGLEDTPALIVWDTTASIRGWEANVPFLKKYGWLLTGCQELLRATNDWRMRRGDKVLKISQQNGVLPIMSPYFQ